jgi:hypothetical protein
MEDVKGDKPVKMVEMYSFRTIEEAKAKAADFKVNEYRLDIFEKAVNIATCNFLKTGGGKCGNDGGDGGVWIVAGTKGSTERRCNQQ